MSPARSAAYCYKEKRFVELILISVVLLAASFAGNILTIRNGWSSWIPVTITTCALCLSSCWLVFRALRLWTPGGAHTAAAATVG